MDTAIDQACEDRVIRVNIYVSGVSSNQFFKTFSHILCEFSVGYKWQIESETWVKDRFTLVLRGVGCRVDTGEARHLIWSPRRRWYLRCEEVVIILNDNGSVGLWVLDWQY